MQMKVEKVYMKSKRSKIGRKCKNGRKCKKVSSVPRVSISALGDAWRGTNRIIPDAKTVHCGESFDAKVTFEKDGVDEIRRIYIIYSSFHRIHHWERNAAISTWNCAKLGTSGPYWTDQEMEERVKTTYPEVRNSARFRHDGTGNPPVAPTQGK